MRHNPTSQVLNTATFLDFARTKPKKEVYDYTDPDHCAIAQFMRKRLGHPEAHCNSVEYNLRPEFTHTQHLPPGWNGASLAEDRTWGALAGRLEALLDTEGV